MVLLSTPEWHKIKENLSFFLSRKGVSPFVGFALSQAHKAVIKGENLNLIRDLIRWGDEVPTNRELKDPLKEFFTIKDEKAIFIGDGPSVKCYVNDHGFPQIRVAGRDFDIGVPTKAFLVALKKLEGKYGFRSEAAAQLDYDYKSLGHAVRLLGQAEEFLNEGKISLPRPNAEYLKTILRGEIDDSNIDWFDMLNKQIDNIKQNLEPNSSLPEKANWKKLNKLCVEILKEHLNE